MQEKNIPGRGNYNFTGPELGKRKKQSEACMAECEREGRGKQAFEGGQGSILGGP